ncbi:PAS domain-containing protein [Oricola nitratireducens]|uniref:PAS domain-containing protein n=1 Tax=Oricola nitratireducens TaxID=2775868 RepID=UPI00186885B7|nr:PAS domain-containing protein [Oricola nitratireducens]
MTEKTTGPHAVGAASIYEIAQDGTILACEADAALAFGYEPEALVGAPWSILYPISSRRVLEAHFIRARSGPAPETLQIKDAGGQIHDVAAIVELREDGAGRRIIRIFKWLEADFITRADVLAEDKEILADIVEASDDPGWCIQFLEPVDLSAPEQEIVRQVFGNKRRWRCCNSAMARFYRLPDGEDLNDRPVDEIFALNPDNEEFVRLLIRSNFDVVRAVSFDTRYDGVTQAVENDVRGLIRNNHLYRMWGTVRDVSQHHRRTEELKRRIADLETYLSAVPDALVLLDHNGAAIHANAIAQSLFGMAAAEIDGASCSRLLADDISIEDLFALASDRSGEFAGRILTTRAHGRAGPVPVEINLRTFGLNGETLLAMSLRPANAPSRPARPAQLWATS